METATSRRAPCIALPCEVWSAVADALLVLPESGGVAAVVTLGLACRSFYAYLVDCPAGWRTRCYRNFGRARVDLHTQLERFGISWMGLYVALARVSDQKPDHRTPGNIAYMTRRKSDGFKCGRLELREGTFFRPARWRWTYLLSVRAACSNSHADTVVGIERGRTDCGTWASMRRVVDYFRTWVGPITLTFSRETNYCPCDKCDKFLYCEPIRRAVTYAGGWKHGQPRGRGRATFGNGFVYDGEWRNGVPDGNGCLNGVKRLWCVGRCAVSTRVPIEIRGGLYTGQVLFPRSSDYVESSHLECDDDIIAWMRMCLRWSKKPKLYNEPYGHGTATCDDGRVYVGSWRYGRMTEGRLTLPDGTVLEGRWHLYGGEGTYIWNRGVRASGVKWYSNNRLAIRMREPNWERPVNAKHFAKRSPPDDYASRRAHGEHVYLFDLCFTLPGGDTLATVWKCGKPARMEAIESFAVPSTCPDVAFAHKRIEGCDWTCRAVGDCTDVNRHACPDDYVYWPADKTSAAFRLFDAYVRARLIGWPEAAIAFYIAYHDMQTECKIPPP